MTVNEIIAALANSSAVTAAITETQARLQQLKTDTQTLWDQIQDAKSQVALNKVEAEKGQKLLDTLEKLQEVSV